jgi:hypothetical protein
VQILQEDDMSSVNEAVLRAVVLWLHAGIGPMFGAGPMELCTKIHTRRRKFAMGDRNLRA